MEGGRIFLKTFRASLFNEEKLNEPYFDWIHLAGKAFKQLLHITVLLTTLSNF
jgi:hypothetical protein